MSTDHAIPPAMPVRIREAVEGRDFVTLGDILACEATQTCSHWRQALDAIREIVRGR